MELAELAANMGSHINDMLDKYSFLRKFNTEHNYFTGNLDYSTETGGLVAQPFSGDSEALPICEVDEIIKDYIKDGNNRS